jgi:albonoursin synthase
LKNPTSKIDHNGAELSEFSLESQHSIPFDGRFLQPGFLVEDPNPMMPLLDAIWTRRTSRSYNEKIIPPEVFEWLITQAMNAPTACNEQQWKIISIDDSEIISELYRRGTASFLENANQCFLVCYNHNTDNGEWLDHIQSGAAFVTLFQLVAHSMGIGSCWIGHLPNKSELRRLFKIHRSYDPVALVSYGYYKNKVRTLPRKHDVSHVIMKNRFFSDRLVIGPNRGTLFRTIGRYFYYKIPPFIRRKLRNYTKPYEKKFYYEEFD